MITDEEILHSLNYKGEYIDCWGAQQVIKLLAYNIVKNYAYLVLDSNSHITRMINENTFKKNGKYIYEIGTCCDYDRELEVRTSQFLEIKNFNLIGITNVNQIFIKDNIKALSKYIENKKNDSLVNVLMNGIPPLNKNEIPWTEFHMYGLFCAYLHVNSNHIFEHKHNVVWINPLNSINQISRKILRELPLFVKMYKDRSHTMNKVLSDEIYKLYVTELKSAVKKTKKIKYKIINIFKDIWTYFNL